MIFYVVMMRKQLTTSETQFHKPLVAYLDRNKAERALVRVQDVDSTAYILEDEYEDGEVDDVLFCRS